MIEVSYQIFYKAGTNLLIKKKPEVHFLRELILTYLI